VPFYRKGEQFMKYTIHTEISDNPLNEGEARQVIKDLQPLIVDIVVNGMQKLQMIEKKDSPLM
jgi:hypothetical protein